MKANNCTHINAILDPKYTWCPDCQTEPDRQLLEKLNEEVVKANKLAEDFECFYEDDEEDDFDEHNYLTSVAEGAGYEMDIDGI